MAACKTGVILSALAFFGICYGLPSKVEVKEDPPVWGEVYSVQGMLQLPYAEINEPFSSWYDSTKKRSRIDYYGGMVMTIQRADLGQYGEGYKVAPLSTYKVRNLMSCFKMPGFSEAPVDIQVTLPDLTGFQNIPCQKV